MACGFKSYRQRYKQFKKVGVNMEGFMREMTEEEVRKNLYDMIDKNKGLLDENKKLHSQLMKNENYINTYKEKMNCQIAEMQKHIDCLQEELEQPAETEENIIHCGSAIVVAQDFIEMSMPYIDLFGNKRESHYYSKSELKQIAEHLMVYVNNTEDRE